MLDNHYERDGHGDAERQNRGSESNAPLSDREVPLAPVATSDVIHRWLDGEIPEPQGMRGDAARSVEFWRRIGEETERRRHMVTPAHLSENIMAAIAHATPQQAIALPWWKKSLNVSAATAVAVAAGLFLLGMLFMSALRVP